eukprot:jgi/Picre1/29900/NNA_005281.t1
MSEYHTIYKGDPYETTEWDEIQRKHGNLPPKESKPKPPDWEPEEEDWRKQKGQGGLGTERAQEHLDDIDTLDELEELEDEFEDDRFLEEYRRKRMLELEQAATEKIKTKQELQHMYGQDFVKEVNEAVRTAEQYPETKWVKIISTECIPGYNDDFLPTLLLYHEKKCQKTIIHALKTMGGQSVSPARIALFLNQFGPICGDSSSARRGLVTDLLDDTLTKLHLATRRAMNDFNDLLFIIYVFLL